jgi:CRISPR/Cas system CSM-associated protein Csm3 (group 7 of RAMP superfamily)
MNPYDFVRIDWTRPLERRPPIWHHKVVSTDGAKLYAGSLEVEVEALTPFFISDPRNVSPDPKRPAQFIHNVSQQAENSPTYIIPGSSLKGMLRNVVETLGNGCLTLYDGTYERNKVNYKQKVPDVFQHCDNRTNMCIACRIFGMLKERTKGVFLGKVNIGDAYSDPEQVYLYEPMYTALLMEPKSHHRSFYLDKSEQHIAGRKFYFHHSPDMQPLSANGLIRNGGVTNRYIQPLDYGTKFHFRVNFMNLEADEFAALLLAITLTPETRHKLGYGKPLGLGSVQLTPTSLTLIDYRTRYAQVGSDRGKTILKGECLQQLRDELVNTFSKEQLVLIAMQDLQRIWRWPPEQGVDYYYPSKRDWFDTPDSIGKRIADTQNVP